MMFRISAEECENLYFLVQALKNANNEEAKKEIIKSSVADYPKFMNSIRSLTKLLPKREKNRAVLNDNNSIKAMYTKDEIERIFEGNTDEEIIQNYSLKNLTAIYICVYGKAGSKLTKCKIVSAIRGWLYSKNRAIALMSDTTER